MNAGAEIGDWTSPGPFEVAPGVFRLPLPLPNDGLRAVNAYVIVHGATVEVIDPGWDLPESRERLAAGLETLDFSLGDIGQFLVTHVHRDHYTQAVALRRDFGTTVSLGSGERYSLEALQDPDRKPLGSHLEALRASGASALADALSEGSTRLPAIEIRNWMLPDRWLEPGQITLSSGRTLEVIETPGHTRGHVVFHDPAARLLFAGDHVLPTITPSIGFEQAPLRNPLAAFLGSLARVRELPDATLLPAHGPVTASVHARVDELVEHHGRRLDHTEAAVGAGADTAHAVAEQLRWTRRERRLSELDLYNQMLAVLETRAHLILLVAQGRASVVFDEEGIEHYGPLP
jgi:glyoxylase-like metal-dependent hydrolase (beta-lactamase superfamily II)